MLRPEKVSFLSTCKIPTGECKTFNKFCIGLCLKKMRREKAVPSNTGRRRYCDQQMISLFGVEFDHREVWIDVSGGILAYPSSSDSQCRIV